MSLNDHHLVVFVTTGSIEEARSIANAVVEAKLAACGSIIQQVQSIFMWQGKKTSEFESLLVLKTTSARYSALEERIKSLHSYSVPEIIALPIILGSQDYLAWLEAETK